MLTRNTQKINILVKNDLWCEILSGDWFLDGGGGGGVHTLWIRLLIINLTNTNLFNDRFIYMITVLYDLI